MAYSGGTDLHDTMKKASILMSKANFPPMAVGIQWIKRTLLQRHQGRNPGMPGCPITTRDPTRNAGRGSPKAAQPKCDPDYSPAEEVQVNAQAGPGATGRGRGDASPPEMRPGPQPCGRGKLNARAGPGATSRGRGDKKDSQ